MSVRDGPTQIWIRRSDGTRQKLTQDGTVNWRPTWTPDGRSIAFVSNIRGGGSQDAFDVYRMPVDGMHRLSSSCTTPWPREAEFSRDGQWLVVRSDEPVTSSNLRGRRLSGDTALVPLVVDKYISMQAARLARWPVARLHVGRDRALRGLCRSIPQHELDSPRLHWRRH